MNGLHWMVVGLGIVLSISSTALRVDDPMTPYDESETPFDLVVPVSFNIVVRPLTAREARRITIFKNEQVRSNDGATTLPLQFRVKFLNPTLLC